MNRTLRLACLATAVASSAFAANTFAATDKLSKTAYKQAHDQVEAAYKAERDTCSPMSGNAKDICVVTAKGREKVAMANLKYQNSGDTKDMAKLVAARYDSRFEVAKEMCDDEKGNAKNVCVAKAKAEHDKAKADAKAKKEVMEARNDAADTKDKADYKVAAERCDAMSGDAKSACVASAKARFNQ